MRILPWLIALLLVSGLARAELTEGYKETRFKDPSLRGLLASAELTHLDESSMSEDWKIVVTKKFVRLPIQKQIETMRKVCVKIATNADTTRDHALADCSFYYPGFAFENYAIAEWGYSDTSGPHLHAPYIEILTALRD